MVEVEVAHQPEGFVLVRLGGEIDMSHRAPVLEGFLRAFDAAAGPVVVDLCAVRFLSVAGADWVDAAVVALEAQGRAVRVVCPDTGPVWRIVALLRLHRRWPVHHDIAKAVAGLGLGTTDP